jgi:hypothetical protein
MEPASLALSIVGVATTFDTVIKCLDYIRIGKSFGRDFEGCLLKLDNARLRLSRWGLAVGLNCVEEETTLEQNTNFNKTSLRSVNRRLEWIQSAIEEIEEKSQEFGEKPVSSSRSDLTPAALPLHVKIDQIVQERRNKLSKAKVAKWAIYEKPHFEDLINRITEHTDALIKLFPGKEMEQEKHCKNETAALCEGLGILQRVIGSQDERLAKALKEILEPVATEVQNNINYSQIGVVNGDRASIHQTFGEMKNITAGYDKFEDMQREPLRKRDNF